MSIGARIFAATYDRMTAGVEAEGLAAHREALLARASGNVLEIGAGTGHNLPFYGDAVESLTLTEPADPMASRLERRLRDESRPVELVHASVEHLPFEDGAFDTVVSTLVLCSVPDQTKALAEIRRVLRPGGELLFIEHVRSDDPGRARWQNRLNRFNRIVAQGCNCNRDTVSAVAAAGFEIAELEHGELKKAPPHVRPLAIGSARR